MNTKDIKDMKNIFKSLCFAAVGAAALGFTACGDKYLEVDHYDIYSPDLMYQNEEYATRGLNGIYDCLFKDDQYADAWNYKPQLFFGCHPTLDTQCTGWDTKWCNQTWTGDDADLGKGYNYSYRAIGRANEFLAGLETSGLDKSEAVKASDGYRFLDGEAHALRAYFYMFLAQNWGRVPMLATGETFINTPNKAKAATDDETWDFIIADLKKAAEELDWAPHKGQYGRATKGMALSYLGEAYLWKAYKARVNGEGDAKSKENIKLAKAALEEVINSGTYELAPSYTTLWDNGEAWPKEAVWQVVNDMGAGNYGAWNSDAQIFNHFFAASTNGGGGWGSQYMSWELYFLFELGDKRRDASMCTSPVPALKGTPYESKYCYGYHPYMQQYLGLGDDGKPHDNNGFMFNNGEFAPSIWTMKLWRLQRANWATPHSPCHFYYKRYAGVLLDYAECLFRLNGGSDAQAWAIIDQIRNRAFGNLEVGKGDDLTAINLPWYNSLAGSNWAYGDYKTMTEYPIPFNTETVAFTDAQTYYTNFCNNGMKINVTGTEETLCLPFAGKAEPWEVALGQERRKEFNSEWNLKADLQRSEFLPVHIECDYPKGVGLPGDNPAKKDNWHYYRDWDFNPGRLVMPFPTDEILKNTLIEQNEAYK